jgi:hypothetical protein
MWGWQRWRTRFGTDGLIVAANRLGTKYISREIPAGVGMGGVNTDEGDSLSETGPGVGTGSRL